MRERRRTPRAQTEAPVPPGRATALTIFAVMTVAAPLCFGAVYRLPQIGLLVLLLVGILAQPPAMVPLSRWGNRFVIAVVAILLFKEFAPAGWFGDTAWRTEATQALALSLPFTHHPEPGRAIDGLLAGVIGVIWFLWVRRLASERENRPILAWTMLAAAAIVAIVSFATRDPKSEKIYGWLFVGGWRGFGPFPNRNHTADFFAMAAVLGCGCLSWAGVKKRWPLFTLGVAMVALVVVAILFTESRGGLLAFVVGLAVFLLCCMLKVRNRRALGAALGAALIFGGVALAFGSQVFARFSPHQATDVSALNRLQVWKSAIGMWKDAPLLGHGIGVFASVFPFYQKFELENQIPIHPESSWLQWLTEVGAIPVLLTVVAGVIFLGGHLRDSFSRHHSFFLRAGGFAAGAVILVHAFVDVPAHRWGTAGFALAALAIACPMRTVAGQRLYEPRQTALVPLAIALFWTLPFLFDAPQWSPTSVGMLINRNSSASGVPLAELEAGLRCFPLKADLHQAVGFRLLQLNGRESPQGWQREFRIASRLVPGVWDATEEQALAVQRISPMMAVPYWQQTVAHGGIHRDEKLAEALRATGGSLVAYSAWGRFVESNPELLLAYARLIPEAQAGYYYGRWWKLRGQVVKPATPFGLSPLEIRDFYALAGRWGNREQLDEWMAERPSLESSDYREWATLLHRWGDDVRAWELLSRHIPELPFPAKPPTAPRPQLESIWRTSPQNVMNAQQLAQVRNAAGDNAGRDEVILAVSAQPQAPQWFIDNGAHILARQGRIPQAVALLLRPRQG